jgi:NADH-quinone oxidoreductase subunit K
MELNYYFGLAIIIFAIGIYGVLTRSNPVALLLAIELLFNAVNLNLVAAGLKYGNEFFLAGEIFVIFIIAGVAAKAVVILALIFLIFREYGSFKIEDLNKLRY